MVILLFVTWHQDELTTRIERLRLWVSCRLLGDELVDTRRSGALPATSLIFGETLSRNPVVGLLANAGMDGVVEHDCGDRGGGVALSSGVDISSAGSSRPIRTRSWPPRMPRVPPLRQSLDVIFFRPGNWGGSPNSRLALILPLMVGLLAVPGLLPASVLSEDGGWRVEGGGTGGVDNVVCGFDAISRKVVFRFILSSQNFRKPLVSRGPERKVPCLAYLVHGCHRDRGRLAPVPWWSSSRRLLKTVLR